MENHSLAQPAPSERHARDLRRRGDPRGTILAAALVLTAVVIPRDATAQRLNIRTYTQSDPVPHGQIYDVHQDGHGFIWLASNAGLGRYDGRQYHPITADQGLASNSVVLLDELPGGDLVAGTQAGVCRIRSEGITCVGSDEGLVPYQLRDLHVDDDGSIWVAADGGISLIRDGSLSRNFTDEDGLPSPAVLALARDNDGTLWAGTNEGLARLDGETWTPAEVPAEAGRVARALESGPEGLLLGTDEGLFLRMGDGWERVPLGQDAGGVRHLSYGPDGTLWVGGLRTLHRYADGISVRYTAEHGLPTQDIWDVEVDREGNVWVGSDEGLAKIVPGPFALFTDAQGLPHPFVRALTESDEGELWFGTREGLAVWRDPGMQTVPFAGLTPDDRVYSLAADPAGGLLVGTARGLVHRTATGELRPYGSAEGVPHNFVPALLPDGAGGVWVGTSGGLVRWRDGGISQPDHPVLVDAAVLALARDSTGGLWVGLSSNGLLVVDGESVRPMGASEGLSDQAIWSMAADGQGGVWVGTNGDGAFYVSQEGVRQFTRADGLGDDFVWQVMVDSRGDVWFFTGNGLNRLRAGRMAYYGTADGLVDLEGAAGAVLEDSTGNLWFGAGLGVYRYDPAQERPAPPPAGVILESVSVGGSPVELQDLTFPPRPRSIAFRFSVPTYRDESGIRFTYRLGASEAWSDPMPDPTVSFARLGHGRYDLEIVAETDGGLRGSEVLALSFRVQPAIWETWWFRGLALLGLASLILSLPSLRARHLEAERTRLEVLVGDRTKELEEKSARLGLEISQKERAEKARAALESRLREAQKLEAVGRLAGGVAHDFNNLLAVVVGEAGLLAEDAPGGSDLSRGLQSILTSANRGADMVSRLLAFSQKQLVRWERLDLGETVRETIPMLGRMLEGQVELVTSIPTFPLWVKADREQLNQVLVNLAMNAKDAMPSGGTVHIALSEMELTETASDIPSKRVRAGRYVVLKMSDTGEGMDDSTLGQAFEPFFTTRAVGEGAGLGLSTVHGIVEMSGGFVQIRSTRGTGTDVEVYLPTDDGADD